MSYFWLKVGSPFIVTVPFGFWAINKRNRIIRDPIMERCMLFLKHDQRILDFCGDEIKPGYWISENTDVTDNYVKYDFKIKGTSGDLGATIISDYLTHRELRILEEERADYFKNRAELMEKLEKTKDQAAREQLEKEKKDLDSNYIPIDFDSYSIIDKDFSGEKDTQLSDDTKIWRVSSLTAYVDNDTKILLMPVPESKRKVKIKDTKYSFSTIGDLFANSETVADSLIPKQEEAKRFEDKTEEEINEDMVKKRHLQMRKMIKIRKYQFFGFVGLGAFYFFGYRKYLHPKSIMNSVLYHNSIKFIQNSNQVKQELGANLQMMMCNGKQHPLSNNCRFSLVMFGDKAKGKFNVKAEYEKSSQQWIIKYIDMLTSSREKIIFK